MCEHLKELERINKMYCFVWKQLKWKNTFTVCGQKSHSWKWEARKTDIYMRGWAVRERQPISKMVLGAWYWSFLLFFLHGFRIPQATEDIVPRWGWLCVHNRRETVWTEIQLHWGMSIVSSRGQPSRFWIPFREVAEYFFLTCKFMFSQVKCRERRQSFSLGMSDLKKKISFYLCL